MLKLQDLSLCFGSKQILSNVNLTIDPGDAIGLIGPSGAGKSSLLRIAAGILSPTNGLCSNSFKRTYMVFQEPRLLPWRSVADNIDIAMRCAQIPADKISKRRNYWLDCVGLTESAHAWPAELSGGMAQRAALARALALEPDLLLLDEPFSALDPDLRAELGQLCVQYTQSIGAAVVCISHQPWELKGLVSRMLRVADGGVSETVSTEGAHK